MDKHLTVYPIASGNTLNIFANDAFADIRIMDMSGNLVYRNVNITGARGQVDITELDNATYIVEVVYANNKTARSVFVKL